MNNEAHKHEMQRRKLRRAERTPGFTPVAEGGKVYKKNEMPLMTRIPRKEERRSKRFTQ